MQMNEPEKWAELCELYYFLGLRTLSRARTPNFSHSEKEIMAKHHCGRTLLHHELHSQWIWGLGKKGTQQRWDMLDDNDWVMFDKLIPGLLTLKLVHM